MRRYVRTCFLTGIAMLASNCSAPASHPASTSTPEDKPSIASQVRPNWNVGSFADDPNCKGLVVTIRIALLPDGTITKIEPVHDQSEGTTREGACYQRAYESARRALLMTHRLTLPAGKTYSAIIFKFMPKDIN